MDGHERFNLANDEGYSGTVEAFRRMLPTFNHEYVGEFEDDK